MYVCNVCMYVCMQILCIQQLPGNNSWAQLPTQTGKLPEHDKTMTVVNEKRQKPRRKMTNNHE